MNGQETTVRLGAFLVFLALFVVLEIVSPRRRMLIPRLSRWANNFGISLVNSAVVALLLPLVGIAAAVLAGERNWGIFNRLQVAPLVAIPLYIVAFDLTIYLQHRLFHQIKPLWRLHRVHHTDLDYDVSSGVRFHPLSILLSALIKLSLILALGPPAVAVLVSEILLNATSMFNHSNIRIPDSLERVLRTFLVTPDMHRVHHSTDRGEHNQNFGFNFPWWDRLLGTYKDQPDRGHEKMVIGLEAYGKEESVDIVSLLSQPFRPDPEERP